MARLTVTELEKRVKRLEEAILKDCEQENNPTYSIGDRLKDDLNWEILLVTTTWDGSEVMAVMVDSDHPTYIGRPLGDPVVVENIYEITQDELVEMLDDGSTIENNDWTKI